MRTAKGAAEKAETQPTWTPAMEGFSGKPPIASRRGDRGPVSPWQAVPSLSARQFGPFVLSSPFLPVFFREAPTRATWLWVGELVPSWSCGGLPAAQPTPRGPQPAPALLAPHPQTDPQFPLEEPADFLYLLRTQKAASLGWSRIQPKEVGGFLSLLLKRLFSWMANLQLTLFFEKNNNNQKIKTNSPLQKKLLLTLL